MVTPSHLSLGEVIRRLRADAPDKRVALGFLRPCSYRGYYEQLAFVAERNVTVGEMLRSAESAMGATFQGWKGGAYEMREYTDCWLVAHPGDCGESIGAVLLESLLADPARDPTLGVGAELSQAPTRQTAYDAVHREIRRCDYDAAVNAFVWRCVHAALDAMATTEPASEVSS